MMNKIAFAIGYAGRKTADYLTGTDEIPGKIKELKMSYEAGTKGYAPKTTKKRKTKHSKELEAWAAQNNWVLPK